MPIPPSLLEYFYPGSSSLGISSADGTVFFYDRVNSLCPAGGTLLDYGASDGASIGAQEGWKRSLLLLPRATRRIGADVDPAVRANPYLQESHVLRAEDGWRLPLADNSVDLVLSDWVIEHLPDPAGAFRDIHRVLRPGGWFCARTGNLWHYAYGIANLVKNSPLEGRLLNAMQGDRHTWPKTYRANTRRSLRSGLRNAGFAAPVLIGWDPEPAYLMRNWATFLAGVAWQRLACAGLLPKATLLAFARKS